MRGAISLSSSAPYVSRRLRAARLRRGRGADEAIPPAPGQGAV